MEQIKALNALEPFLALAKSATSPRAAADLVVRATSAPNTYLFTELLQTPQIQALASSPEHTSYLPLLQIFSYGTYATYREMAAAGGLPDLVQAQLLKLRQLSLLTLAKGSSSSSSSPSDDTTPPTLSYASLIRDLNLPSARELEELVISTIYAGLIDAQLDPKNEQVLVNSVSPLRDVAPGPEAIGGLLSSLRAWAGRCDATLQSLEEQMAQIRAEADRRAAEGAAWNSKMDALLKKEEEKGGAAPNTTTNNHHNHHGAKQTGSMLTVGALSFPGHNNVGSSNVNSSSGAGDGNISNISAARAPGGSSSGGGGSGSGSSAANNRNNSLNNPSSSSSLQQQSIQQRYGKRGADDAEPGEIEEMDLDDEEGASGGDGGNKRANKRKL